MNRRRVTNFLIIICIFLFVTFFFSTSSVFLSLLRGDRALLDVWGDFRWNAFQWMPWAFFTPFILWLLRKCPLTGKHCLYAIPLHLAAAVILSFVQNVIVQVDYWVYYMNGPFSFERLIYGFAKYIHLNILTYGIIVGASYLIAFYRQHREGQLRASKLESQLTQAQLEVLKMQLHPHFLFNTLHAISALVYKNPKAADKMISRLSDLLRLSLESSGRQEVPLKEEMEALKIYLDIEKTRFQDRLTVDMEIETETLDAMVPNLILQPLVENAVRHGVCPKKSNGKITISALHHHDRLIVQVADDGKGFQEGNGNGAKGIGLRNTRERLEQMYGEDHRLVLRNGEECGAYVTMEIPFRLSELVTAKEGGEA